jgi:hypothetical protein
VSKRNRGAGRRTLAARALAISISLAAAGVALSAIAEAAPRVVVLRAPGDDALTRQAATLLVAELQAGGFDVVEIDRNPRNDIRADIDAVSARVQPVATFAIRPMQESGGTGAVTGAGAGAGAVTGAGAGAVTELWIEDRVTGKLVIRRIDVGASPEAAADLALKAVELLHGSLLEVTVEPDPRRPPTPPEVTRWLADSAPDRTRYFAQGFGIAVGAGALGGTGVGFAYGPMLRIAWGGAGGFAARITAHGLGSTPEVRTAEGVARVHQTLALAEGLRVFRPRARLQPLVGAGAGIYRVRSDGTGASTLFPSGAGTTTAAAFAAEVGLAARLAKRVALVADAGLLLLAPTTRILIASREAARTGGLSFLATLSVTSVF